MRNKPISKRTMLAYCYVGSWSLSHVSILRLLCKCEKYLLACIFADRELKTYLLLATRSDITEVTFKTEKQSSS